MKRAARVSGVSVIVASWLGASSAQAQPRSSANDDVEAQHNQGNRLREQGRHAEARDLFRALYARTHEPRALVRQGLAEMALQEWVAADEHLTAGLATTGNRWIDENRARIQGAAREVQTHVGTLVVECSPPGATVSLNGTPSGQCPMPGPMRRLVGPVTVRVEATGAQPMTQTANIVAGSDPTVLRMYLAHEQRQNDTAARDAVLANNRRRSTMLTLGGVALGLGVAGLGVGAAGFLVTDNAGNPLRETMGIVGFAAGGALAVTGVVLLVAAPRRQQEVSAGLCGPTFDRPGLACAWRF